MSEGQRPESNGCGGRTRTSIHGFKVRCPTVRRHRNKMVRTEGLAPPITRARGERVRCYTTSGWCWQSGGGSSPGFTSGQLISSPDQTLRCWLRTWSSARESHPAFLHVGQAWSLAHSPTKIGCRDRIRTYIFRLNRASHYCCATRQWWAGTDSHRDLLCVGEVSLLLDDPPENNGATDGCCPRYLLLDRQATLLVCPRSHGQVAGICTRFSGFTGRCPAHWATHLIKWSERRDSHSRDLGPKPSA
jgi:hypothetical protein